jgi:hypothetical protein
MAAIKNSLDKILQASVPRFAAPTDRAFFVNPEQAIFKVSNGIASPSSFNFTPTLLNMAGTVSYVPSAGLAISVTDNKFSLAYSDMTAPSGSVVATLVVDGVTYTRTILVSRIIDGVAPKLLDLAASSQVFKVDKAGVGAPGSIELIAKGQNLAGTPNFTILSGAAQLTIGSDATRKQLTFANMATDLVQVQVAQDGQVDTVTIVKVREGADGAAAIAAFLTNESQTVPANLDGTTISMAGATTAMKVYVGTADETANWTFAGSPASSASALTYTLGAATGLLTASALNAGVDAAYVDITASRAGYASVTKRFSITKSKTGPMGQTGLAGARGNVNLSVITSGVAWSDAEANAAVFNLTGTAARSRDVVNLYRGDRTWAEKRIFDGFNWSVLADAFDGSILVKGTVLADAIDSRGLTIKDAAGNIIIGTNVPIPLSYAPLGTKNSELAPSIQAATDVANNASGVASAAKFAADAAVGVVNDIGKDNILSRVEKKAFATTYVPIYNEVGQMGAQANALGVNHDVYDSRWNALVNYVESLRPDYRLVTQDTPIDGAYLKARFVDYYDARTSLVNAISNAASKRADWDKTAGRPADSAILNSNVKMNSNLAPSPLSWGSAGHVFHGNCGPAYNTQDTRSINGEFFNMGGQDNVFNGFTTANDLGLKAWEWYTVSFLAHSDGQIFNADFIGGGGVDTNGINIYINRPFQYVTFTEQIPGNYDNATGSFRFWTGNNGQGVLISNLKIEKGMAPTPYTNDVITPYNALRMVMPNSINNTMFGGDLYSVDWNGRLDTYGAGWLLQRGGRLYANSVALRGAVSGGAYTDGYAWPQNGAGGGFHISAAGALWGNPNQPGMGHFQIEANGNVYAPGFSFINRQLTLTSPVIITPRISTTFSATVARLYLTRQTNGTITTSIGVGVYNGSGNYAYSWTFTSESGDNLAITGSPSAASLTIRARGSNTWVYGYASVTVRDLDTQAIAVGSAPVQIQFGNAAEA